MAEKYASDFDAFIEKIAHNKEEAESLQKASLISQLFANGLRQYPDIFLQQFSFSRWQQVQSRSDIFNALTQATGPALNEPMLMQTLRVCRRHAMWRWHWLHSNKLISTQNLISELSHFADACIHLALIKITAWQEEKYGRPYSGSVNSVAMKEGAKGGAENNAEQLGEYQRMSVIAMGKLGAGELNLSSDIDLMFVYPSNGETQISAQINGVEPKQKSISNQQFFARCGQQLIKVLDAKTADGFVFRVDMRLRPYGGAGALALSYAAMETYYEEQGREWERYALIKARIVEGESAEGESNPREEGSREQGLVLMTALKPFVFRRYIDYSVIESLREMKGLIQKEVRRKGLQNNVKTGLGGIREIEFIAQALQLVRGGREVELQERALLKILPLCVEKKLLPAKVGRQLVEHYVFLRDVEHAIQTLYDQQTQTLPSDEDDFLRLVCCLGFSSAIELQEKLDSCRAQVHEYFVDVVAATSDDTSLEQEEKTSRLKVWVLWWESLSEINSLPKSLRSSALLSVQNSNAIAQLLFEFKTCRAVQTLNDVAAQRLHKVVPLLLNEMEEQTVFSLPLIENINALLEKVLRRSAYLSLLCESVEARRNLVYLLAHSEWAAGMIVFSPVLLDELTREQRLYTPPDLNGLQDDLRQQLLRIPEDDMEAQMECLRHFKASHALRVAASEMSGSLPLMQVSDYLSFLATTILQEALNLAWQQMLEKYGRPDSSELTNQETNAETLQVNCIANDFAIIAYGKLGGVELSYHSDLDLVFLYAGKSFAVTDGERSISNEAFYSKLAQRIIHLLSTRTYSGQLYEVDARLRPAGASGLLVSSFSAFEKYQRTQAWTWEHQALVRARVVAGCAQLSDQFVRLRGEILSKPREEKTLRSDVSEMRVKMQEHLGSGSSSNRNTNNSSNSNSASDSNNKNPPTFIHLKQDSGGVVDIEFIVQYAVLRWANQCADLLLHTDNVRILETLGKNNFLDKSDVSTLFAAYLFFRGRIHALALQNKKALLPVEGLSEKELEAINEQRKKVQAVWGRVFA